MKLSQTAVLGAAMALSLPLALPATAMASDHSAYQQKMVHMSNNMQWQGQQTIQGKVQSIDQDTGIVKVSGQNDEQLKLHFPPTALQNVKEGDQVAVQVAYASGSSASQTNHQYSSSMQGRMSTSGGMTGSTTTGTGTMNSSQTATNWEGGHTMPATVTSVDQNNNTVKVQSEGHELVLPAALSQLQLNEGEQVKIHLVLRDMSSTGSSLSR